MIDVDLSDVVRAVVIAGDATTPYLTAGRGVPVVVLTLSRPASLAMLRALPRRFRALVPTLPSGIVPGGVPAWLDGFLDALGIGMAWIIADAGLTVDGMGDRLRLAGIISSQSTDGEHSDRSAARSLAATIASSVARIDAASAGGSPPLTGLVRDLS